jgi:hypothetical protein
LFNEIGGAGEIIKLLIVIFPPGPDIVIGLMVSVLIVEFPLEEIVNVAREIVP